MRKSDKLLTIDSREPINKIKDAMLEMASYAHFPNFTIEALEYGDYLIDNNDIRILVERKEYKDYMNSIGNDLSKRFLKMKQESDYQVLILEGQPPKIEEYVYYKCGINNNQGTRTIIYNNYMFSRALDGIIIMPTIDIKHTMLAILYIHDYTSKIDKKSMPKAISTKEMLELFPGVGRKKANKLSKNYKNMAEAMDNWREWIGEKNLFKFLESW